jgi:AcrR family transcriptional regulator
MSMTSLAEPANLASVALRNEPVQARSTARLAGLLDAAAQVVHEIGYERLTTAMVAERAGASIGTVYRYFPDRIAVLQALAARNLERTLERTVVEINDAKNDNWIDALSAAFGVFVEAFRNEAGFRSLRVGDVIDLRPAPNERTFNSVVADTLRTALVSRFDLPDDEKTAFLMECAIEISDAMAARAFLYNPEGEESFLDAGRDAVYSLLAEHFGEK